MSLIFFMVKVYEVKCSELLPELLTQFSGQIVSGHPEEAETMWSEVPWALNSTSGPPSPCKNPLIAIYFEDG